MSKIAIKRVFDEVKVLRGPEATFENVDREIKRAAGLLKSGGLFLFTFAGHGCRLTDSEDLPDEEPDSRDEAIVLFDRLLLDDYLHRVLWPLFAKGVRIVAMADSCHSGTSLFASMNVETIIVTDHLAAIAPSEVEGNANVVSVHTVEHLSVGSVVAAAEPTPLAAPDVPLLDEEVVTVGGFRPREITVAQARAHFTAPANEQFYDDLLAQIPSLDDAPAIRADLLTVGACEDDNTTADGAADGFGAFTTALLEVWNGGAFSGTYLTFRDEIGTRLPNQVPTINPKPPPAFSAQQPFSI